MAASLSVGMKASPNFLLREQFSLFYFSSFCNISSKKAEASYSFKGSSEWQKSKATYKCQGSCIVVLILSRLHGKGGNILH